MRDGFGWCCILQSLIATCWFVCPSLQELGDNSFFAHRYQEAAKSYGAAIECIRPSKIEALLVILYLNRAGAYMKLGEFFKSIADCSSALEISPDHAKCLQRRAMAYVLSLHPSIFYFGACSLM